MAVDDHAIDRADLMWVHDQLVADADFVQRHLIDLAIGATMCDEGHSTRERPQHRRRASERERLEGFAARQHQYDKRAREVLLEQHRGDDRDAGQQIRAELAPNELEREGQHKGYTAGCEHDVQGQFACGRRRIGAPAQCEMRDDTRDRKGSDNRYAHSGTWPPGEWPRAGALPHCDGWTRYVHEGRPLVGTLTYSLALALVRLLLRSRPPESSPRPREAIAVRRAEAGFRMHYRKRVCGWRRLTVLQFFSIFGRLVRDSLPSEKCRTARPPHVGVHQRNERAVRVPL